ncbi:MAG TPA: hypothetical protein VGH16_11870 [Candidatus Binatia bacterium]|jgi:hypothetical protein
MPAILVYFSAATLLLSLLSSAAAADFSPDTLILEVRLSRRELRVGENIIISGIIRNNSSETVYLHKPSLNGMGVVDVYPPEGKRQSEHKYSLDILSPDTMDHMAEIRAGEAFVFEFSANLVRETIPNYSRQNFPEVDGVFLDLGYSSIFIEQAGTYGVRLAFP